jgi:hypothetical protein
MSTTPGKVLVDGVATIDDQEVFVLKMIQGRNPEWANRIFFARFDPTATSLDQLEPAFDRREFFFEQSLRRKEVGVWRPDMHDGPKQAHLLNSRRRREADRVHDEFGSRA